VINPFYCDLSAHFNGERDRNLLFERKGTDLPSRGVNAVIGTGSEIEECACPVCEILASSDADYFARAFGDSRRFAATSEAVTDTLGFCPRHGAALLSQEHLSRGIVHVFRDVIPRTVPLLAEEYIHEDRVQQVFFGTSSACPACAHANRAVARHAGRLARRFSGAPNQTERRRLDNLCVRHFQLLAGELKSEIRMAAFTHYADALNGVVKKVERLLRKRRALDARPLEQGAAALHHALDLVAGRTVSEPVDDDHDAIAEALQSCPTLAEGISYPKACPLCLEVGHSRRRWIQGIPVAAKFKQIAWLFFPICPEHISAVVRLGDTKLTATVVTHALQASIGHIHQQILALVRAAEIEEQLAQEAARFARWGTRPRKKAEGQKPITVRPTRCPGCERLVIAEDHATGSMLQLLQQRKYRNAFHRGYGLCMKHFAQVYVMAPKGVVRSMLAEDQKGRLAELALMLDEMVRTNQKNGAPVKRDVPRTRALRRFCGLA
jgi:hypothetical protein